MQKIHLLVGSETGTAVALANSIATFLTAQHCQSIVHSDVSFEDIKQFPADDILFICTSTCGDGDLPDNIKPFYKGLLKQPKALTNRRYGLICLGDSTFRNFAGAGKKLHGALQQAGLSQIGEPLIIDGFFESTPLNQAQQWLENWAQLL